MARLLYKIFRVSTFTFAYFTFIGFLTLNGLVPQRIKFCKFYLPQAGNKRIITDVLGAIYTILSGWIVSHSWQLLTNRFEHVWMELNAVAQFHKVALILNVLILFALYFISHFTRQRGAEVITHLDELKWLRQIKILIGIKMQKSEDDHDLLEEKLTGLKKEYPELYDDLKMKMNLAHWNDRYPDMFKNVQRVILLGFVIIVGGAFISSNAVLFGGCLIAVSFACFCVMTRINIGKRKSTGENRGTNSDR